jgi:hypothetical protein
MRRRWFLEATGASLLIMLPFCNPLLFPGHVGLLHHQLAFRNIIGGLLIDMFVLFVLGIASLALISRLRPVPRRLIGAFLAAFFLWRFCQLGVSFLQDWFVTHVEEASVYEHSVVLSVFGNWPIWAHKVLAIFVLLLVILTWFRPTISQFVVRATRYSLAAFAFCAIWMLPQLLYLGFVVHEKTSLDHSPTTGQGRVNQRLVWILFDELSENLLDHPPSSQRFINFEKLRSRSISFINIQPVGFFTERVIPSLLAGHKVNKISSTLDGKLLEREAEQPRWRDYDPNATLLGDAAAEGWKPGVAGWHVPYCRLFSGILTECYWEPPLRIPVEALGASEEKSIAANSLVIPRMYLAKAFLHRKVSEEGIGDRIEQYQNLMADAKSLIQDDRVRFTFIHLPVPHPPGFYDRKTHRLCECGNYIDNLFLADDALGELVQEIEHTSSGNHTTIIVSSDHSWRVLAWKRQFDWSQEEERISKGQFDSRPVFFIHFPGEESSEQISSPTPELLEHDVISEMLRGRLLSAQDLTVLLPALTASGSEHSLRTPLEIPERRDGRQATTSSLAKAASTAPRSSLSPLQ